MTRQALIVDGRVHEIWEGGAPPLHPSLQVVDIGPEVALGWIMDGEAIVPPPGPGLEEVKVARKAEVDARLALALAAGMAYGGKLLQIREQDQQNIIAMSQRAALALGGAVEWPANFGWRMADNTFLPVATPAEMIALATAAADEVYRLRLVAWSHKDAIAALTTVEAVEAHDIEQGWDSE